LCRLGQCDTIAAKKEKTLFRTSTTNGKECNVAQKIYVIDTNVLLYDPRAIFAFEGAMLGIPIVVLEELDTFKEDTGDRGRNARAVNRILDKLRLEGSLRDGVALENGGTLKVIFQQSGTDDAAPFIQHTHDNSILNIAYSLKKLGYQVKFISKDINARVKADVLGLEAEDYLKDSVSQERFYHGWRSAQVPAVQLKTEFPEVLAQMAEEKLLLRNEFVLVESNHNPFNYKVFRYVGSNKFQPVRPPELSWPLEARNPQQLMALDLLLDPTIQLVTLFGPAGTGKTFLALLAGLHQVLVKDEYQKMLISRPVIPLGKDIGYLPGDIHEKLHSWMLPIYDNLEFIVHHASLGQHLRQVTYELHGGRGQDRGERGKYEGKHNDGGRHDRSNDDRGSYHDRHREQLPGGLSYVDDLIRRGKLSLEAITYMRGRSIPYQFIFIDEVQNLTPHEVKTLITRVGEGSKIVLAGDPYQIDSPYLDFSSNGLVVVSERFKGEKLFGSVYLENSERSELSKLAGQVML
jgi:PhoH-like ATPase